jgi:fibronectin-binding autotransporter adhesin
MKLKSLNLFPGKIAAAALFTLAITMSSTAATVTMTASDTFGEHSFDAGNNYFTGPYILRSPNSGSSSITFLGDSLTISPGGALYCKLNPLTMTVNTLTNNGRVVNAQGGTFTVLGNMYVPTNNAGGGMDTGSGNSSVNDVRTITCAATISGQGALTNYTSETAGSPQYWLTARGIVIYTGNNTAFTGRQVITKNTIVRAGAQANLGGNPSLFEPAQLELNNGIFQPTNSLSLNNPNSGITIAAAGGSFDIATGLTLTNANPLAGPGTLSLTNTGTLRHEGAATNFTGTLSVGGGTVVLAAGGSLAGSNTISISSGATLDVTAAGMSLASGQTLAGNGTVLGTVTAAAGTISPGGSPATANLPIGALTLNGGAKLAYDFGGGTNDVIVVSGNLSASGVTTVKLLNVPSANGTYTLITVAGTLGGSAANFTVDALQTRSKNFSITYDLASTPKRVLLQVSGSGSAADLVWQGNINSVWDIFSTSNWLWGASSDAYYDADNVNFTDAAANFNPTLDVTVNPGAVNFSNSTAYTLTGNGAIAGAVTVIKTGTGTALLAVTNNTYSGGTIITDGVLTIGAPMALGNPSGSTLATVSGTGMLQINGAALDTTHATKVVRISGHGAGGAGAIDNTVGGLTSGSGDIGIGSLELTGNATVGATANWQVGHTGSGIIGNGYTLTKRGTNYLYLKRAATSPLGGLVIDGLGIGGGVLFWDSANGAGTTATITLTNGGFIDTWDPVHFNNGLTFYNPIVVSDAVNGGRILNHRAVTWNRPPWDVFNGNVVLNGPLTISNMNYWATTASFGRDTINGNITGTGGVNVQGGDTVYLGSGSPEFYGGNLVILNGNNSYSGPTTVSNLVQLLTSTANQSGGTYHVADYATLDVAVAPGKPTIPMQSLALQTGGYLVGPGNLGFTRLAAMPASPVVYATNLTINNGVILPPKAAYSIGQFPLVKYGGSIGGNGFAGLQLGSLPAGVAASLVNNSGNQTIDLQVTAAGVRWTGAGSSDWDTATVNWFDPVSSSSTTYADGQTVVFDDTASTFNITIQGSVQPGGVTVNSASNYSFTNALGGGLTGSGALIKNGTGTLIMACTNNTFTGGTFINGGTIKLADRTFAYPYGGGALNNNLGTVTIASGGTLDINGIQVPNYQSYAPDGYNVFVSGSGVGGNGALVNNDTNAANNDLADPGYVTLVGDATVGGAGDINIRHGVAPQMSSQSSAYTLTKVGAGQFRVRYIATVSTNFGTINILGGIVSYESSSSFGFGDPTKSILVGNGAGFAWGSTAAACVRPLICSNNATIYARNSTANVINSPVTLNSGNVNLNANFYNGMTFSNVISGAGGVSVLYQSLVTFAAPNTYSGDTVVWRCNATGGGNNGSVLRLVGNGSMNNSPNITLQGITATEAYPGALDASGRSDGTLTVVGGQTLRGDNGSYVRGNAIINSGATLTPGGPTNIQSMTFSNNLVLSSGSTVVMDVSLDAGVTNDFIRVVGLNNYAGTLQLANIGAAPLTNGASFQLFSNGSFGGNFASISGSPGAGMSWSFNPTNGIATVVSVPKTQPRFTHVGVNGTTLTISATNGTPNATFVLLQTTNLALQLSQWTPALTNVFDSNGNLNMSTNIVTPGRAREFYILRY